MSRKTIVELVQLLATNALETQVHALSVILKTGFMKNLVDKHAQLFILLIMQLGIVFFAKFGVLV